MKKNHSNKNKQNLTKVQRDAYAITTERSSVLDDSLNEYHRKLEELWRQRMPEIQKWAGRDRRFFDPDPYRLKTIFGTSAAVKLRSRATNNRPYKDPTRSRLVFERPLEVGACIKRKNRRRALFRLSMAKVGGGGVAKMMRMYGKVRKTYNFLSELGC